MAYDEAPVIDGLDLAVERGSFTVIVGPNGCGKSTLLRALARTMRPRAGRILLDGAPIAGMRGKEVARRVALLPQSPIAPEAITVGDLVARGRFPHQGLLRQWSPDDARAVAAALEATETVELRERLVSSLSGGQRQRVWLAMALAQETEVLLLDEPTTFLDVSHQVEVLDLLTDLNRRRGTTIVMVLHGINLAARYADHLFAMCEGRLVASGAPGDVVTSDLVRQVFGLDALVMPDPVSGSPIVLPRGRHHVVEVAVQRLDHVVVARHAEVHIPGGDTFRDVGGALEQHQRPR